MNVSEADWSLNFQTQSVCSTHAPSLEPRFICPPPFQLPTNDCNLASSVFCAAILSPSGKSPAAKQRGAVARTSNSREWYRLCGNMRWFSTIGLSQKDIKRVYVIPLRGETIV